MYEQGRSVVAGMGVDPAVALVPDEKVGAGVPLEGEAQLARVAGDGHELRAHWW